MAAAEHPDMADGLLLSYPLHPAAPFPDNLHGLLPELRRPVLPSSTARATRLRRVEELEREIAIPARIEIRWSALPRFSPPHRWAGRFWPACYPEKTTPKGGSARIPLYDFNTGGHPYRFGGPLRKADAPASDLTITDHLSRIRVSRRYRAGTSLHPPAAGDNFV
jgi:hypothetical protein